MKRVKAYSLPVEVFEDLLAKGHLFRFKGIPGDARIVQISHDFTTRGFQILLSSDHYPEIPEREPLEYEYLQVERWETSSK